MILGVSEKGNINAIQVETFKNGFAVLSSMVPLIPIEAFAILMKADFV